MSALEFILSLFLIVYKYFLQSCKVVSSTMLQISFSFMKRIKSCVKVGSSIKNCDPPRMTSSQSLKDEHSHGLSLRKEILDYS